MSEWATRIPAAIKRAEELLGKRHVYRQNWQREENGERLFGAHFLTATEVALAKALWAYCQDNSCPPWPPALIAFTEKVESLDA